MMLRSLSLVASLVLVLGLPAAGLAGIGADSDGDGILDDADNCQLVPNPTQCDVDADDYGNACDCDFNNDTMCDMMDLSLFSSNFGSAGLTTTDMNCDGVTQMGDFGLFASGFQTGMPGPSGTAP